MGFYGNSIEIFLSSHMKTIFLCSLNFIQGFPCICNLIIIWCVARCQLNMICLGRSPSNLSSCISWFPSYSRHTPPLQSTTSSVLRQLTPPLSGVFFPLSLLPSRHLGFKTHFGHHFLATLLSFPLCFLCPLHIPCCSRLLTSPFSLAFTQLEGRNCGRARISYHLQGLSSRTKNQINMRPSKRRKIKFGFPCIEDPHRHEHSNDIPMAYVPLWNKE